MFRLRLDPKRWQKETAAGFGPLVAERSGLLALPALDRLDEDAADGRQRLGLCGEQQAEFERDGQDPLSQGEVGSDDMVDQVRGRVRHAAGVARGADAAELARER